VVDSLDHSLICLAAMLFHGLSYVMICLFDMLEYGLDCLLYVGLV